MTAQDVKQEMVGVAAVVLIALLSLSTIKRLWTLQKPGTAYRSIGSGNGYEDQDGVADEDSIKAYSTVRPRVAAGLAVFTGLSASIACAILDQRQPGVLAALSFWSDLTCWTLMGLQWAALPSKGHYLARAHLSMWAIVSSLLLAVSIGSREGLDALSALSESNTAVRLVGILDLAQFVASLGAAAAFAAFPRRPDVYDGDKLVDQQRTVSLLRLATFDWNRIVFRIAKQRQMTMDDLPALGIDTKSRTLQARFHANRGKGALWWQLIRVFSYELVVQWFMTFLIALMALFPQVVLYNFLERIESKQDYTGMDPGLFVWVFGLLLSQLLQVALNSRLRWITFSRLDLPVTALLQGLVFSKALKQYETASPANDGDDDDDEGVKEPGEVGKSKSGPGKKMGNTRQSIINHMKLDSARVSMFCVNNNNFPMALFKLVLSGGYLMNLMGWKPVAAGLACGALVTPLSAVLSKRYGKIHFSLMRYRDGKAHLLTEALEGMRQIKYSALEQHWEDKIIKSREEELKQYWWLAVWQCGVITLTNLGPLLLASVTFTVYTIEKGTGIKASVIFASLGLFEALDAAIALLPLLQMYLIEAYTSAVRLEKFFNQADKDEVLVSGKTISLEKVTVGWPKAEHADGPSEAAVEPETHSMLRDINVEFPSGKLSVITGKTGSGKSLLLATLLGEVKLLAGTIRMPTRPASDELTPEHLTDAEWIVPELVAFVAQTPWIESTTIKENIVFGLPFNESRFQKVIHACALENDIELFVDGVETEVGPKGVTLSGGQRWRVALARALYSRAGTILMDDVLSAVDAHVGRHIRENALTGELAKGRTRILATHHAELVLSAASLVVRLCDGKLESVEVPSQQVDDVAVEYSPPTVLSSVVDLQGGKAAKKMFNEEEREQGRVKGKVYYAYYKAAGGAPWWIFASAVLVFANLVGVMRTWSLKELSQQASSQMASLPMMVFEVKTKGIFFWLTLYVALGFGNSVITIGRIILYFYIGQRAARVLFERLTHAILRAPLRWITTVPAGRILNRFTSDTFTVDRRLSGACFAVLRSIMSMAVILAASLSVSYHVMILGVLTVFIYYQIAIEYIGAAREVKRINSTSSSPIFDSFSSVLSGLSTIRAFGRSCFYNERMYNLIDDSSKASWALNLASRWMGFRMGMLGAVFVTTVATAIALGGVDAALAGFSLTFALRYTGSLTGLLQTVTSVELGFNACERVLEYCEIDTDPEHGEDARASWPEKGEIEVENLTVSYAPDLPAVLKDLTFRIGAGERVGIVGRTGAGKSTLASVLFRLLEPRNGVVRIDGVDISKLKLHHLRSRLAIIPQDPFLFSGTLRSNLDMEGVMEDRDLHQALERVHLVEQGDADGERTNIFKDLSTPISAGGGNLSQGQRQLVCLARALLSRPKIVVLDEATSAVDRATDTAIQASLRAEFASQGCTVLVIAHRLTTVADFDQIMVMRAGRLAEMGPPSVLVERGRRKAAQDEDATTDQGEGAESGSSTQVDGEEEEDEGELLDGTGAFWDLVQKSAERDKLLDMIGARRA